MSSKDQLSSLQKCRDIKEEIIKFGIKENELKHLIKILALELEDRDLGNLSKQLSLLNDN